MRENLRTFQGLLKDSPTDFKDLKLMKTTDRSVKNLLQKSQTKIMETLILGNSINLLCCTKYRHNNFI